MQIYDTKVNHLTNPLGFQMKRMVFSWKVKNAKGKFQISARILVAADENMQDILFDSGYDPEADSLAYPVSLTLMPCTRYYWTVSVKSDQDEIAVSEIQ